MTAPTYEQLQALIAVSDPTTDIAYWRSLFADGHRADLAAAYRQGREDMAAEYDDLWRTWAAAWSEDAQIAKEPDGPAALENAQRRLRAAEAGCRRDAADHERAFIARAHNTADQDRTHVQRATMRLQPRKSTAA